MTSQTPVESQEPYLRTAALMNRNLEFLIPTCTNQYDFHQDGNCPVNWESQVLWNTAITNCFLSFLVFCGAVIYPSLPFSLLRTIIEWSESHDRGYGKFQTAKMEDFTFNDLYIKLGFPYLYCHQGDCEHVVVITDIR